MSNHYTALVVSKKEAAFFKSNLPKAKRVYAMTPNAFAELNNFQNILTIQPLDILTDPIQRDIINELKSVEENLELNIKKNELLNKTEKENLLNNLHIMLMSVLNLWHSINNTGPWCIVGPKGWEYVDNQDDIFIKLFYKIYNEIPNNFFDLYTTRHQKFKNIIKLINYIILKITNKKKYIWINGKTNAFKKLIDKVQAKDKEAIFVFLLNADEKSLLRSTSSLLNLLNPFKKKKMIGFTPVYNKNFSLKTDVTTIIKNINCKSVNLVQKIFIKSIYSKLNYIGSLQDYTDNLFKKTKSKLLITDGIRWSESLLISSVANKNNVKKILISHGSVGLPKDETSKYLIKKQAQGLLFSNFSDETVVQSKSAEKCLNFYNPNMKRHVFRPIMWSINEGLKTTKTSDDFTILHASTPKVAFGGRIWTYESPSEYIENLKSLILNLKNEKNIKFIIKARPTSECDKETILKTLPQSDNCIIKFGGDFSEDLRNADLLVSYSSTTIEQALYSKIPVIIYHHSDRYSHIIPEKTEDGSRNAVYVLNKKNFIREFYKIIKLHKNKPLTENELKEYIWQSKMNSYSEFVNKLVEKI